MHLYKRSRPSVCRSVRRSEGSSVEGRKSSNDIINNDTMSDDEVVASDVLGGTCFFNQKSFYSVAENPFLWLDPYARKIIKVQLKIFFFYHRHRWKKKLVTSPSRFFLTNHKKPTSRLQTEMELSRSTDWQTRTERTRPYTRLLLSRAVGQGQ